MNKKGFTFCRLVCALFLCFVYKTNAVTLVYNMKVRRIFTVEPVLERMKSRWLFSAVPIFFARSRHLIEARTNLNNHEKRKVGGVILNLRYIPSKHWWIEATTGIETDHGTFTGSDPFHASRTGFDDLVFAGGYHHFFGKKIQGIGYGLFGVPTRRKVTLEDRYGPLVGTRLFGIGFGLEGSYSFLSELHRSFAAIIQGRFLHGFNRSWFPVLPRDAEIQPGNSTDLLFTLQFREKRTIIEAGYDITFFTNQAILLATQTIKANTFILHSGFASISHALLKGPFNKPLLFGAGCNVNRSKQSDARNIIVWLHCTFVF